MKILTDLSSAKHLLQQGGVLAYPTEAVYGLGCDPFNVKAVQKLIALKGRESTKGLIVLIASYSQLFSLIQPLNDAQLKKVKSTWPGFVTWVLPALPSIPQWITGGKKTIAIRMSNHPIAKALCEDFPIVSTSANLSGQDAIVEEDKLLQQFASDIDGYFKGPLGQETKPSPIFDLNGKQLR